MSFRVTDILLRKQIIIQSKQRKPEEIGRLYGVLLNVIDLSYSSGPMLSRPFYPDRLGHLPYSIVSWMAGWPPACLVGTTVLTLLSGLSRQSRRYFPPIVQGGPSGHGVQFVDIKLTVPPLYTLLIRKRNYYVNVNKSLSLTRWTTLHGETYAGDLKLRPDMDF